MKEIVLDTETTGLDYYKGDRLVEIGAIELINHIPTGKTLQFFCNVQKKISEEASKIHGITNEFLSSHLTFKENANNLINFIKDDTLVIHNASFDLGFLNAELKRASSNYPSLEENYPANFTFTWWMICTLIFLLPYFFKKIKYLFVIRAHFDWSLPFRRLNDAEIKKVSKELIGHQHQYANIETTFTNAFNKPVTEIVGVLNEVKSATTLRDENIRLKSEIRRLKVWKSKTNWIF